MSVLTRTAKLGVAAETVPAEYEPPGMSLIFSRGTTYRQRFAPLADETVRGNDPLLEDWQQGPSWSEWRIKSACYPDTAGLWLRGITGPDTVTPGITTTLSAAAEAGADSVVLPVAPAAGSVLMIGAGSTLEYVTTGTPAGTGPYTVPLTTTLRFAHSEAETAVTPAAHALTEATVAGYATYSLTMDDGTGPLAWPGCSVTRVALRIPSTGQAALTVDLAGFPPSACDTFTYAPSAAQPFYGWAWQPSADSVVSTRGQMLDLVLAREPAIEHAINGQQAPLGIWPGPLTVKAAYTAIFENEDDLELYVDEVQNPVGHSLVQPALQGGAQVQIALPRGAWTDATPDTSGQYLAAKYVVEGVAVNPAGPLVQPQVISYVQTAYGP